MSESLGRSDLFPISGIDARTWKPAGQVSLEELISLPSVNSSSHLPTFQGSPGPFLKHQAGSGKRSCRETADAQGSDYCSRRVTVDGAVDGGA